MTIFDGYEITRVERTIITARNFQKRLFCMSVDAMKRLLREVGLIGPSFRCYDFTQCLRRMSSHLNLKAFNSYYDYKRAIVSKVRISFQRLKKKFTVEMFMYIKGVQREDAGAQDPDKQCL